MRWLHHTVAVVRHGWKRWHNRLQSTLASTTLALCQKKIETNTQAGSLMPSRAGAWLGVATHSPPPSVWRLHGKRVNLTWSFKEAVSLCRSESIYFHRNLERLPPREDIAWGSLVNAHLLYCCQCYAVEILSTILPCLLLSFLSIEDYPRGTTCSSVQACGCVSHYMTWRAKFQLDWGDFPRWIGSQWLLFRREVTTLYV